MIQPDTGLQKQTFTLPGGIQIVAYVSGAEGGFPVVLLHGGGTDHARLSWGDTMPALVNAGYRVYAPNFPGYGDSPPHDISSSTNGLVQCVEALMNLWKLDKAALVGLSMGGGTALGYTLMHQPRVERLVLVGSYGMQDSVPYHFLSYLYVQVPGIMDLAWGMIRNSRSTARYMLNALLHNPQSRTEALVDEVMEAMKNPHSQRAFGRWQRDEMLRDGMRTNYTECLEEITIPVLLIHGAKDAGVPLAYAQRAASKLPNARLKVIENAGHWTQRDYPEKFNRLLLEFLEGKR